MPRLLETIFSAITWSILNIRDNIQPFFLGKSWQMILGVTMAAATSVKTSTAKCFFQLEVSFFIG